MENTAISTEFKSLTFTKDINPALVEAATSSRSAAALD